MTTSSRNSILFVCLMLFLACYGSYWAFRVFYLKPRQELKNEIAKVSNDIQIGRENLNARSLFFDQYKQFYMRSLPLASNSAQSQYFWWLLESLQYSGFENNTVVVRSPTQLPPGRIDYSFSVQCSGSLTQLSYFLFEFYYAPFLHRITSMTLTPIDGHAEKLTFSLTVDALALRPHRQDDIYPMRDQIPSGYFPRLRSNDLTAYQAVIAERNLLQTAKGGIDKADHTILTAILHGHPTEVWFSIRTDDSTDIKAKLGDSINAGSFSGKVVEIFDQDIVLERGGTRWLMTIGESLKDAFALPPETAAREE